MIQMHQINNMIMVIYISVDAMINDIIETTSDDVLIKARVKERGMPIK